MWEDEKVCTVRKVKKKIYFCLFIFAWVMPALIFFIIFVQVLKGMDNYHITSMSYRLRRQLALLCRWPRAFGFGIQSPWAYHFVTQVVNDRTVYKAYRVLQNAMPADSSASLRLARLFFRFARAESLTHWCIRAPHAALYGRYIQAGYPPSKLLSGELGDGEDASLVPDVYLVNLEEDWKSCFLRFIAQPRNGTFFIVEGISLNRHCRRIWKEMVTRCRQFITFDLFDCGIILYDPTKTIGHYRLIF